MLHVAFRELASGRAKQVLASQIRPRGRERHAAAAPSHRVFVGKAEVGAAWTKRSNEGRDYLSVKLDDPSFALPIYANLFDAEGDAGYSLIWCRGRKAKGE